MAKDHEVSPTDKSSGLLPCPFCGGAAFLHWSSDQEVVNARCLNWGKRDGCLGAGANCYEEDRARAAWNRRVVTPSAERATNGRVAWLIECPSFPLRYYQSGRRRGLDTLNGEFIVDPWQADQFSAKDGAETFVMALKTTPRFAEYEMRAVCHEFTANSSARPRYSNPLKVLTSEWRTDRNENEVTCHSRMVDGVLCRWWGDDMPPGVAKIDAAASAKRAREGYVEVPVSLTMSRAVAEVVNRIVDKPKSRLLADEIDVLLGFCVLHAAFVTLSQPEGTAK